MSNVLIDHDDNLHTFTHFLFVRDDRRKFERERERGVHTYLCTSNINKMLHQVDHTTGTLNVYYKEGNLDKKKNVKSSSRSAVDQIPCTW